MFLAIGFIQVRLRLQTHHQNVEDVLSMYQDVTVKVCNGGDTELRKRENVALYVACCSFFYFWEEVW